MKKKFVFKVNYENQNCKAVVEMELNEDNCLSICGELRHNGEYVMCGQCLDELKPLLEGNKTFEELYRLWKLYHLNDMHAGTVAQEEALEKAGLTNYGNEYEKCCDYLKSINLYDDNGYKFGHGWLKRDIPEEDLKRIKELLS